MAIIGSQITNDLDKNDNKLSFKFNNTIEYEYEILEDTMLIGASEPVGVIRGESLSVLEDGLIDGYDLKKVYTENVTVELYADADNNSFYEKTFVVDYYMQTKGGGGTSLPDDGGDDSGTNGDGSNGGDDDGTGDDTIVIRDPIDEDDNTDDGRDGISSPEQFF